jgi:uncharacterized protein
MRIAKDDFQGNVINGYDEGFVVINHEAVSASVIVTPREVIPDWSPRSFDELTEAHISALAGYDPEIVLIGTGSRLQFPPHAWISVLLGSGVGVEVMDTGAACRTYNVLSSEGRRVVAALLMI